MKWLPYQSNWINDKSRLKILVKSRRIGGSYSTSYAVWKRLMTTRNHDIVVVTRDENLAVEFVADVSKWIRMWNFGNPLNTVPEKCLRRLSLEIPHRGGRTRLLAVSSNPDAAAGKGGDLIIDEMALHKDQELLMRVAQPIITAGGNLTVLSTHRSKNSLFNQLCKEAQLPESQWSYHKTDIIEAVDQGFLEYVVNPTMLKLGNEPFGSKEAYIQWLMSIYDEYTWSQEFMCQPTEESTQLISEDEINLANLKYDTEKSLDKGLIFIGWDIAESVYGDYATTCVLNASGKQIEMVHYKYFEKGTSIQNQMEEVERLSKEYGAHKIVVDANGIGRHPANVLQGKLGEQTVIAFSNTLQSKEEMYSKTKRYFQNAKVRIPRSKMIKDDFESIERMVTNAGNVVYKANYTNGSHADLCSAFSMALSEVPENTDIKIGVLQGKPTPTNLDSNRDETAHERSVRHRKEDKKSSRKRRGF